MELKLEKHDHHHNITSPFVMVNVETKQVVAVFDPQFAAGIRLQDVYEALSKSAPPPLTPEDRKDETR